MTVSVVPSTEGWIVPVIILSIKLQRLTDATEISGTRLSPLAGLVLSPQKHGESQS
ncbi:MAG: hypothetical protein H7145_04630 [Akkermansiaceae bacterium]|nr:hypothetical protein [Armatimonadota bacterium]